MLKQTRKNLKDVSVNDSRQGLECFQEGYIEGVSPAWANKSWTAQGTHTRGLLLSKAVSMLAQLSTPLTSILLLVSFNIFSFLFQYST